MGSRETGSKMVMMNQPTDFIEQLLFGDDFLTMNGEVIAPMSEVADQRLDLVEELSHPEDQFVTLIPDMDMLLENDDSCPKAIAEVVIQLQPDTTSTVPDPTPTPSTSSTSVLEQEQNLIFQFPSTVQDDDLVSLAEGSFLADLTDVESSYSSTVPSTPFSPGSPYSLPPETPDTAGSSDSGFGPYRRSVKSDLRSRIQNKRQREGKGQLKVEFVEPEPERLTEDEQAKREEKREKNKMAAQKCREKKRQRAEVLEAEIKVLERKQSTYELDIQKLMEERDHLRDIINVHGTVCSHFRLATATI